jgi:hypothetical protein
MDEAGLRQLTVPAYITAGANDTQAPPMTTPKLIAAIPAMSGDNLSKSSTRACGMLAKGPNDLAQSVIEAIEEEWKIRRNQYLGVEICLTRPTEGMLAALPLGP